MSVEAAVAYIKRVCDEGIAMGIAHEWSQVCVWTVMRGTVLHCHATQDFPLNEPYQRVDRFVILPGGRIIREAAK